MPDFTDELDNVTLYIPGYLPSGFGASLFRLDENYRKYSICGAIERFWHDKHPLKTHSSEVDHPIMSIEEYIIETKQDEFGCVILVQRDWTLHAGHTYINGGTTYYAQKAFVLNDKIAGYCGSFSANDMNDVSAIAAKARIYFKSK
jgi:hypothetical protein